MTGLGVGLLSFSRSLSDLYVAAPRQVDSDHEADVQAPT
jgi:hypothetical protein